MFIKLLLKNSLPNCFNSTPLKIKMNIKLKSNIFFSIVQWKQVFLCKRISQFPM